MRKSLLVAGLVACSVASAQYKPDKVSAGEACDVINYANTGNPMALVFRDSCYRSDARYRQNVAKILGRPVPSTVILELPASGTPFARKLGYACIAGLAMKRLPNGWEQVRDTQYRYARCRVVN